MDQDYKKKYEKYKGKCIKLINKKICFNFFFIHQTRDNKSLISILNDGYIFTGAETDARNFSGYETEPYVFCNVYFDKIKNIKAFTGVSLLIHPKIILTHNVEFGKGWGGNTAMTFKPNDPIKIIKKNIKTMVKLVKYPEELQKDLHPTHQHEIRIDSKIKLDDYLLGIVCHTEQFDIIKDIINKKYKNIKIYMQAQIPSFNELLK